MNRLIRLFGTLLGRKIVMAFTGLALIGFLVGHMLGNMTIFQGQETLNAYANWLQGHPLVWVARLGLLGIFGVHVFTAISLAWENRKARSVGYSRKEPVASTLSSRYIVVSGILLFAFILFHLGHFTFGWFQPEHYRGVDAAGRHDVFGMVLGAFRDPVFAGIYVLAMGLLGFHLIHGVKSLVQTIGINHDSYNAILAWCGRILVLVIVLGNCSFPILIQLGMLGADGGN